MRQTMLRKDLDDYLSRRTDRPKNTLSFRELFRKKFAGRHVTLRNYEKDSLNSSDPTNVTIIAPEPNFFNVLHDRIIRFFSGKKN